MKFGYKNGQNNPSREFIYFKGINFQNRAINSVFPALSRVINLQKRFKIIVINRKKKKKLRPVKRSKGQNNRIKYVLRKRSIGGIKLGKISGPNKGKPYAREQKAFSRTPTRRTSNI